MNVLEYSLTIFFFFYLVNYAEFFSGKLDNLFADYGDKINNVVNYVVSCAFCFTFWSSLLVYLAGFAPLYYVFSAPVLVLLINLTYLKLTGDENDVENLSEGARIGEDLRQICNGMTEEERARYLRRGLDIINNPPHE